MEELESVFTHQFQSVICFTQFDTIWTSWKTWKISMKEWYVSAETYTLSKSNTPPWVFSSLLKCTNGTKSRKGSFMLSFKQLPHFRLKFNFYTPWKGFHCVLKLNIDLIWVTIFPRNSGLLFPKNLIWAPPLHGAIFKWANWALFRKNTVLPMRTPIWQLK